MSTISDKLKQIETLRHQIEAHGKLPDETLRRIEYRFRLECNYYSNRQEGGTLTRQETRTVMTGIITIEGKPLSDVREMQEHDKTMLEIMRIGQGEVNISEKRIKDIHRAIIMEEDPEKQKQVGEWKQGHNEIINWKGEKFSFTPPGEVPEAMHLLLNWLNGELEKVQRSDKNGIHPAVLAFEFHHRFLTIHPFHDGNGRTARLLSNLILVANGYPPFYINDEEKENYNRYLADIQGYGGDPDLFVEFMLGLLQRSLQLTLDVIEGREVEDDDDWAKKLRLLKANLSVEEDVKTERSVQAIESILSGSIVPLIKVLFERLKEFDDLFAQKKVTFWIDRTGMDIKTPTEVRTVYDQVKQEKRQNQFLVEVQQEINKGFNTHGSDQNLIPRELRLSYQFNGFNKAGTNTFSAWTGINWQLEDFKYTLELDFTKPKFQLPKLYHQFYTPEEIKTITSQCGNQLLQQIEQSLPRQQD